MKLTNVYETCPSFENDSFLLRFVKDEDLGDLLNVYADEKSVPFFNSDNCYGDDFHYTTRERMRQAIDFWKESYLNKYFVRWTIVDKKSEKAIGTIELFHRDAEDYFNQVGLLRLDLKSEYEKSNYIVEILSLILMDAYELFACERIATKASLAMHERKNALERLGFHESNENLIGHDGTEYGSYYECSEGKVYDQMCR